MDNELAYMMALSRIPGVGNTLIKQIISYTGAASAALKANRGLLAKIPGIGQVNADAILSHRNILLEVAKKELDKVEKSGVRMLHYLQTEYPSRLKKIPDAPPVLYLKGSFDFENPRVIAVVGTRQASAYGKDAVDVFLEEMADYKPVVVSGLAYGIDAQAHKASLRIGLETWAVLGTPIRQIYPSVHRHLADQILGQGGLISEVPFDAKPEPGRFPERNRIIAGLSDVIWVVEAKETGGALITARLGLDYFRDVFALPGDFRSDRSAGCHALIASGSAGLVSSGKELAEAAGWKKCILPEGENIGVNQFQNHPDPENQEEKSIIELLREGENHLDEISWRSGIGVNRLAGILLNLEFSGLVKSLPGKKYGLKV